MPNASRINVTTGKCRSKGLKEVLRLTTLLMFSVTITAQGSTAPKNLIAGAGPLKSATKWDGHTAFSVIPGETGGSVETEIPVRFLGA